MNNDKHNTTQTKTWQQDNGTISKIFGYAQDVVQDLSKYHLVIRRPNAKLIDIPVRIPAIFVVIGFVFLLWLSAPLLAIGLAAALYFQLQVSFDEIAPPRNRDVEDVEYREVDS